MDEQDQSSPARDVLRDTLLAAFRQRRVIATIYIGMLVTAVAAIFLLPPQYRAAAKILLTTNRAQVSASADSRIELTRANSVSEEELDSQVQILWSRQLVEEVVKKIGVAPEEASADPDEATWASRMIQAPVELLKTSYQSMRTFYRELHDLDAIESESPLYWEVTDIMRRLEAQPLGNSNVIEVAITNSDPVWARDFVNELAVAYVEQHSRLQQLPAAEDFFKEQSQILHDKLAASEEELRKMREKAGALAGRQEELQDQLLEFTAELARSTTALAEQQGRVTFLEQAHAKNQATKGVVTAEIMTLEATRAELLGRYRPDSYRVQAIDEQLAALRSAVAAYAGATGAVQMQGSDSATDLLPARAILKALKSKTEALALQVEQYRQGAELSEAQSFELARLERQVDLDEKAYLSYVRTMEESRLSNALEQSAILRLSIIEPATIPMEPVSPKKRLILSLALLGGAFFSVAVGLAFEFIDTRIKTAEDVRRYANLDVLAVFPEHA